MTAIRSDRHDGASVAEAAAAVGVPLPPAAPIAPLRRPRSGDVVAGAPVAAASCPDPTVLGLVGAGGQRQGLDEDEDAPDWAAAHEDAVFAGRARLLAELQAGLEALRRADMELSALRSPGSRHDCELAEGRDGRDIAAHIDGGIRSLRAGYAVAHMCFDRESL